MGITVSTSHESGQAWTLAVHVLPENETDPQASAEFSAQLDLFGSAEVNSGPDSAEDFMALLAEAMSNIPNRICHVTLNKVTTDSDEIYST